MIFVPQHVGDLGDLRPWDLRLARQDFRPDAAGCFSHDLNAPLNAMAEKPITAKVVERPALLRGFGRLDRFENGAQPWTGESRHQKTRSAQASISTPKQRVEAVAGRQVDRNAEAVLQELFDADQVDEGKSAARIVVDKEIEVARRERLVVSRRSEKIKGRNAAGLHLVGLSPQRCDRVPFSHGHIVHRLASPGHPDGWPAACRSPTPARPRRAVVRGAPWDQRVRAGERFRRLNITGPRETPGPRR